jgi:hypothetical protein
MVDDAHQGRRFAGTGAARQNYFLNHIRINANLLGKEQYLSIEHEDTGDEARQIEVPRLLSVLENESIVAAVF